VGPTVPVWVVGHLTQPQPAYEVHELQPRSKCIDMSASEVSDETAFERPWGERETVTAIKTRKLVMKITVETIVAAPIEEVWRAYTTPEDIKQWNAASDDWHTTAAAVDLRVGGAFSSRMEAKDGSMGFDFAGTYTNVVKHKLIEYSFGDRTAQVEFADSPTGTKVRVTFDIEATHSVEQQRDGWQAILNNFARHVEARR
jgi:uncharacterized protein YndB with AHSA1/START domain